MSQYLEMHGKQAHIMYMLQLIFFFQLIFVFLLYLGMVMYANELETKEKQKLTQIKKKKITATYTQAQETPLFLG